MATSTHSATCIGDSAKSLTDKIAHQTFPRDAAQRKPRSSRPPEPPCGLEAASEGVDSDGSSCISNCSEAAKMTGDPPKTSASRWQKLLQNSLSSLSSRRTSRSTARSDDSADGGGANVEPRDAMLDALLQRCNRGFAGSSASAEGVNGGNVRRQAPRAGTATTHPAGGQPEQRLPLMSWAAVPQRASRVPRKPVRRRHSASSLDTAPKDEQADQHKVNSAQRALKLFLELESAKPLQHLAREALAKDSKKSVSATAAVGSRGVDLGGTLVGSLTLRRSKINRPREEDTFTQGIASMDAGQDQPVEGDARVPEAIGDGVDLDERGTVIAKGARARVNDLFCLFRSKK